MKFYVVGNAYELVLTDSFKAMGRYESLLAEPSSKVVRTNLGFGTCAHYDDLRPLAQRWSVDGQWRVRYTKWDSKNIFYPRTTIELGYIFKQNNHYLAENAHGIQVCRRLSDAMKYLYVAGRF